MCNCPDGTKSGLATPLSQYDSRSVRPERLCEASHCVSCAPLTLQSTALHMAAKEGHVAAVKLLLERGAEITLNIDHASFLHEAIQHGKKEVVNTVIDSDR